MVTDPYNCELMRCNLGGARGCAAAEDQGEDDQDRREAYRLAETTGSLHLEIPEETWIDEVWLPSALARVPTAHTSDHDRALICANSDAASDGPRPTTPIKDAGGLGIFSRMGFQRCRQYLLLFTYCE